MAALTLEIVTPERRVATVQADEVRAPGVLGGFGIRKDHTPFMSQLQPGRLSVVDGGKELHYAIGGGFLQVAENKVIVLADSAEEREEIDAESARWRHHQSSRNLTVSTQFCGKLVLPSLLGRSKMLAGQSGFWVNHFSRRFTVRLFTAHRSGFTPLRCQGTPRTLCDRNRTAFFFFRSCLPTQKKPGATATHASGSFIPTAAKTL